MPNEADTTRLQDLIEGVTQRELRALTLTALASWLAKFPERRTFSSHGTVGRQLVPLLADRKGLRLESRRVNELAEGFIQFQQEPWMSEVVDTLWWLIRSGHAIPLHWSNENLSSMLLTEAGARLLKSPLDHPLHPEAVSRLQSRCPSIPAEVLEHLADARTCLDLDLLRPAVTLLGLAFELCLTQIADGLVKKGSLKLKSGAPAVARVQELRKWMLTRPDNEKRRAGVWALDFADDLRARRNQAAHPIAACDFDSQAEVEEFYVSAIRRLPALLEIGSL